MSDPQPDPDAAFRADLQEARRSLAALEHSLSDLLALMAAEGETPETIALRTKLETAVALMQMLDDVKPPVR
jgi:hypothetical protein